MNAIAAQAKEARILLEHPKKPPTATIDYGEIKWYKRFLYDLGVLVMADSKPAPPEFRVTYATVSVILAIVTSMAALWWFTAQAYDKAGFERGRNEAIQEQSKAERERLQKQIDDMKGELQKKKELELLNSQK
jgi:hypothetical protein